MVYAKIALRLLQNFLMLLPKLYPALDTAIRDKVFAVLVPGFDLFRRATHGLDYGFLMFGYAQPANNILSGKLMLVYHKIDKVGDFWMGRIVRVTEAS